jgi:YgiT-type zinc finger domain-containing protein
MKPQKLSKELCPMCGKGTTHFEKLDYKLKDRSGKEFVVPDLEVEICDYCGEHIFNMKAVRKARQVQGRTGKILLRLQPTLQNALAARARKNRRSITQEAHHLLENSLQAAN